MKIASIDIGTNTVRCLVSSVRGGILEPLSIHRDIIRLGKDLGRTGVLGPDAVRRLTEVMESYKHIIQDSGCDVVRAVATSAMRDAGNAEEVRNLLRKVLGYPVRVIPGDEEARLTSLGVMAGVGAFTDGIILDIGGGSTELVRVLGGDRIWSTSLPAGVIHLTEELLLEDPPADEQVAAFQSRFRDLLNLQSDDGGEQLAGTAGTPTTLAAVHLGIDDYDPTLVNGHVLSYDEVKGLLDRFLLMKSAQRLALSGMEKGREDLIVAGALMILEVMERWGYEEMIVSDWGLLEGIAIDLEKREIGY